MVVQSKIFSQLPADYGYVVLAGAGSVFINMWMAINVSRARKQYDVKVNNSLCCDHYNYNIYFKTRLVNYNHI
jgi:hypothetical protein